MSASGQSCSPSRGAGWPARNISWSAPSIERSRRLPGHLRLLTRASRRPQAPSRLPLPVDEAPGLLCRGEDGSNPPQPKRPGCSSAWPERALRERDVGGSNPLAPTSESSIPVGFRLSWGCSLLEEHLLGRQGRGSSIFPPAPPVAPAYRLPLLGGAQAFTLERRVRSLHAAPVCSRRWFSAAGLRNRQGALGVIVPCLALRMIPAVSWHPSVRSLEIPVRTPGGIANCRAAVKSSPKTVKSSLRHSPFSGAMSSLISRKRARTCGLN